MPDFTTLGNLVNVRPHNGAEIPKCAACGVNDGDKVAEGFFPDGQEAWFVPLCSKCAAKQPTPMAMATVGEEGD